MNKKSKNLIAGSYEDKKNLRISGPARRCSMPRLDQFSFPPLIVVPLSSHEVDGVRKEKERLTAAINIRNHDSKLHRFFQRITKCQYQTIADLSFDFKP